MIKLTRGSRPAELNTSEVSALTAEFKASAKSVWNIPYIKEALLASSSFKCAYCETKVDEESKYLEVEHFRCKDDFPDLVVDWDNLLPSCKHCNGQKSSHNVDNDGMLLDPFLEEPRDHLFFQNYRLRWRDELGRQTIDTLYLNDTTRLVSVRLRVGEVIAEALETIRTLLEGYLNGESSTRRRNRITRGMKKLLEEAQPSAEYSALAATVLLGDPNYSWIKQGLLGLGLWDELTDLETSSAAIALNP